MLCRIRRNLQGRLTSILTGGYGFDSERGPAGDALLFSGCYFAATGDNEDQQAFVKGVFDKLPEQQEELEWTQEAFLRQRRFQTLAYMGMAIDAILVLAVIGMVGYKAFL
jgi:hypothetical protein